MLILLPLLMSCFFLLACGDFGEEEVPPSIQGGKSSSSSSQPSGNGSSSSSGGFDMQIGIEWQDVPEELESAVHGSVEISLSPFMISKYLITQSQYKAVMDENPSKAVIDDNLPVEGVTWFKAVEFCKKLSIMLGLNENAIRLPTEAEWEFTACSEAAHFGCPSEPAMQRNERYWEWTNDCFDSDFPYNGMAQDPSGPPNCLPADHRVRKGYSWPMDERFSTDPYSEDISGGRISFRIAVRNMDYFQ